MTRIQHYLIELFFELHRSAKGGLTGDDALLKNNGEDGPAGSENVDEESEESYA
jgi:hypothetical protein